MNFCGYKMYMYYMQYPYSLFCLQPKLYVLPGIDSQKGCILHLRSPDDEGRYDEFPNESTSPKVQ